MAATLRAEIFNNSRKNNVVQYTSTARNGCDFARREFQQFPFSTAGLYRGLMTLLIRHRAPTRKHKEEWDRERSEHWLAWLAWLVRLAGLAGLACFSWAVHRPRKCTQYVPSLYPACTQFVPNPYPACTQSAPNLYPICTQPVPNLYAICTQSVRSLGPALHVTKITEGFRL